MYKIRVSNNELELICDVLRQCARFYDPISHNACRGYRFFNLEWAGKNTARRMSYNVMEVLDKDGDHEFYMIDISKDELEHLSDFLMFYKLTASREWSRRKYTHTLSQMTSTIGRFITEMSKRTNPEKWSNELDI